VCCADCFVCLLALCVCPCVTGFVAECNRREICAQGSKRTSSHVAQQPFLLLVSTSPDAVEWYFKSEVSSDSSWTVEVCDSISTDGGIDAALAAWSTVSSVAVAGRYVRVCSSV
jgi:hypothetical protein